MCDTILKTKTFKLCDEGVLYLTYVDEQFELILFGLILRKCEPVAVTDQSDWQIDHKNSSLYTLQIQNRTNINNKIITLTIKNKHYK